MATTATGSRPDEERDRDAENQEVIVDWLIAPPGGAPDRRRKPSRGHSTAAAMPIITATLRRECPSAAALTNPPSYDSSEGDPA